jgi:hypothetical protein
MTRDPRPYPGISIFVNIFGGLFLIGSALAVAAVYTDGQFRDVAIAGLASFAGVLLLGLAYALHKLNQIESHLVQGTELRPEEKGQSEHAITAHAVDVL